MRWNYYKGFFQQNQGLGVEWDSIGWLCEICFRVMLAFRKDKSD